MAGIIFFKTKNLELIRDFYIRRIGMELWLEQADCIILKHGNLLLGFCQREESDIQGIITFVYENTDQVYNMYKKFRAEAMAEPVVNEKYNIYHFFAKDPEGRLIEFQNFLQQVKI
ncbi:MAG: VOC family protein [bacterium]